MDWTIFSYHNVEGLRGIMNAVAAIFGAGDYRASLFIVLVFGFFAAALAYAFAPQKMQGWHWLASVVLIYSVLMLPKSTVQIVDVTADEPPAVVANVPYGLAVLAGVTSQVGHAITSLAETAFSAVATGSPLDRPEELSYERNGMMFGARMVKTSQEMGFYNATLRSDVMDFYSNCIEPELNSGGISPSDFMRATNIWSVLDGKVNPARFTTLSSEPDEVFTCDDAYAQLTDRIEAEKPGLLALLAYRTHPTMERTQAVDRIEGEVTAAYATSQLVAASQSAGDIVAQNAVINAINDGSRLAFVRSGDTTGLLMNQAQSATFHQKNSAFISNAKIAEQALPVVRNVIEGITYALFPLVVLLLMLTSGRDTVVGIRNYASILIWIQLWPPLYAVLNYMASIYAAYDIAAAGVIDPASNARGIALATFGAINDNALSCQAVVGYLTFTIPFLAWSALKRMENFGTSVAGALSGLQPTGDANASAASMGNMSWGMTSRNKADVSPLMTNPGTTRVEDDQGMVTQTTASGQQYFNQPKSDTWIKSQARFNVGAEAGHQIARSISANRSEKESLTTAVASALNHVFQYGKKVDNNERIGQGTNSGREGGGSDSYGRGSQFFQSVGKEMGVGDSVQAGMAVGIALALGKGADESKVAKLLKLMPNIQGSFNGGRSVSDAVKDASQALDRLDESGERTFREKYAEQAAHEFSTTRNEGTSLGTSSSEAETLSRAFALEKSYQQSLRQEQSAKEAEGLGITETIDVSSFDSTVAKRLASVGRDDYQGADEAYAFARQHVTDNINWVSKLAGLQTRPHAPLVLRDPQGNAVLTNDDDLNKTSRDADLGAAHQFSKADRAPVMKAKQHGDAVVGAALPKGDAPDARGLGHVRTTHSSDATGPGVVAEPGTYAYGHVLGDSEHGGKLVVSPDLGGFPSVHSIIESKKTALNADLKLKGQNAANLPYVQADRDGNMSGVHVGPADVFGNATGTVKAIGAYGERFAENIEIGQRANVLRKQNPEMSQEQAEQKVRELRDAMEHGDFEAKKQFYSLETLSGITFYNGRAMPDFEVQQQLRREAKARGETVPPETGAGPIDWIQSVGSKAWKSFGQPAWDGFYGQLSVQPSHPSPAHPSSTAKDTVPETPPAVPAGATKSDGPSQQ